MIDLKVKFSSIKHKLLLAFVAFLLAVTLLNAGLSAYLVNRRSEAEAYAQLSLELTVFKNDLQGLRDSLVAAAREAATDKKDLSDLAILYSQRLKLHKKPDAVLDNALNLNKITSLNRLQLILLLARLSSVAVYLEGDLSHYITHDEAGMVVHRDEQHVTVGSRQENTEKFHLDGWRNWIERPVNTLIPQRVAMLDQVTVDVDFPGQQMMVLKVSVPIQGMPRESFNETIVENLAIATPQTLPPSQSGNQVPVVIGMFVFSKIIDTAYLQDIAVKTGMLPAIFTPDGLQREQLLWLGEQSMPLPSLNGKQTDWKTVQVGEASYYQAFIPWQLEEAESSFILSMAVSRENTLATIKNIVTGIIASTIFILLIGGTSAYFLITRLVAPIKELTLAVSAMQLDNQDVTGGEEIEQTRQAALGQYLEHPIMPQSKDEISDLTNAFNAMARHLHRLIGSLEAEVAERTRALTDSNQQLLIAEKAAEEDRHIAETANRAKSAFLANMSHELRTPLNAILGYAEILKRNSDAPGSIINGLDIIQHSGDHLLTLINDILDLARVEAGKLEIHAGPFGLDAFLEQIMGIIQARAEDKNLSLSFERLSPLPAVVVADETRLRQVLLNLLGNAVKFNDKEGTVSLTVKALEQAPGEDADKASLRFQVEDNGTGIAADQLERIFQPFEQTGELLRQEEGTGLGLAISRQIVQQMGGQLQVKSELGRGSTFWFDLTLPVSEETDSIQDEPLLLRPVIGYEGARRKVLVVDDKYDNRQLLLDSLQPLGFELKAAEDGQQAIDIALLWQPDAIVMDLLMPVKSGFDAVREMRQRPELKDLLIIAVSASVSDSDRGKSRDAGFDEFLPKPIKLQRLFDLLAAQLGLTWVYAKADSACEAPMVAPSSKQLLELYQLVEEGQIFEIQKIAAHLEVENEAYIPFAQQLQKLAKGFDIERIAAFIKQFLVD